MFILVCYDIVDNRKRQRAAKIMKAYGERVQKSVFECNLDDRMYLRMKGELERLIDWEEDSVRYYPLCKRCAGGIEVSGIGIVREEEDIVIV